jgi:hypothetical protein
VVSHTTAELSWEDNFGGVPYFVDYSIAGSQVWDIKTTTATHIKLEQLRPGTRYEARVHIKCPNMPEPYVSVRFETDLYGDTMFAPNPTGNTVTIFPSQNLIGNQYSLYDNTGRRYASGKLPDYTIDLSGYPAGIYFLKIDGEKTMKIVKY